MNQVDVMMDVSQVASGFCVESDGNIDEVCDALAYKATIMAFQWAQDSTNNNEFSDAMGPELKAHLELADDVIGTLNEDNYDHVLEMLNTIQDDVEDLENVDKEYQRVAVASLSVAISSLQQWYNVVVDQTHPLHNLVVSQNPEEAERRRKLQEVDVEYELGDTGINVEIEVDYDLLIENTQETVKQLVQGAIGVVGGVVSSVVIIVTNVKDIAEEVVTNTLKLVQSAAESVVDTAVTTVEAAVSIGQAGVQLTTTVVDATVDATVDVVSGAVDATIDAASTAAETVGEVVGETIDAGVQLVSTTVDTTTQIASNVIDAGLEVTGTVVTATATAVESVAEAGLDVVEDIVQIGVNTAGVAAAAVVDTAQATIELTDVVLTRLRSIIRADFLGANGGGNYIIETITSDPIYASPINWIPLTVVAVGWYAIPSSAAAAFSGNIVEFGGDFAPM